jgi:hypothetical protein
MSDRKSRMGWELSIRSPSSSFLTKVTKGHRDLESEEGWIQKEGPSGHRWLTPVILGTQEAEIRRIIV